MHMGRMALCVCVCVCGISDLIRLNYMLPISTYAYVYILCHIYNVLAQALAPQECKNFETIFF